MSADSTRRFDDSSVAQQRLLSMSRSEREIFHYLVASVIPVTQAEDVVQQAAMSVWEQFDADILPSPSHSGAWFVSDKARHSDLTASGFLPLANRTIRSKT
jgi:hypothetical protein